MVEEYTLEFHNELKELNIKSKKSIASLDEMLRAIYLREMQRLWLKKRKFG